MQYLVRLLYSLNNLRIQNFICYTEPVWAVGFALEQTLHVVALAVFSLK
ncbi:MAG: hypothetical protein LBH59_06905 [Planctomycetaceae bacterium]|nr:hypothetical protein [Planctomycetaceae bacterium]